MTAKHCMRERARVYKKQKTCPVASGTAPDRFRSEVEVCDHHYATARLSLNAPCSGIAGKLALQTISDKLWIRDKPSEVMVLKFKVYYFSFEAYDLSMLVFIKLGQ